MKIFPKTIDISKIKVKNYFQRGRYHFLIYNLDGSITGDFSGLYLPPMNYLNKLEIFIKIGKKWENLHKHINKVKIDSYKTTHYYKIKDLKININIFLPDNHPVLKISVKSNKNITLKLKPIFKFLYLNKYHENPIQGYTFKKKSNNIIITSKLDNKINLMFNSENKIKVNGTKKSLKSIQIKAKKTDINIICSEESERELYENLKNLKKDTEKLKKRRYEKHLYKETNLVSDNQKLNQLFQSAKHNILLLRHRQPGLGRGFLAGSPYFLSFFGRDTFWSLPASLLLGDTRNVKDCLNMFAKYQSEVTTESRKPGKIPHEIWLNGEPNYYSTDSSLLFIISVYNYYKYTQDKEYLQGIFPTLKQTTDFILQGLEKGRIIHNKLGFLKDTTWMDSYHRGQTAVEIQALTVSALECFIKISKILKKNNLAKLKKQKKKSEQVLKKFIKKGYVIDHINKNGKPSKSITGNPLFLLALNLVNKKKAKEIIKHLEEKELFTQYGVRSRAKKSQGYNPRTYHKGGIWPFLTGIYMIGSYNYNLKNKNFINIFQNYFNEFSPGLVPEYLNGNNFNINKVNHKSCYLLLWGSSLFIQGVLQGICGIRVEKGKLKIKPQLPKNTNKIKITNFKFGKKSYDIEINKNKIKIKSRR